MGHALARLAQLRISTLALALVGCAARQNPKQAEPAPTALTESVVVPAAVIPTGEPEDKIALIQVEPSDIPGWDSDAMALPLKAFLRSCQRIQSMKDQTSLGPSPLAGLASDWKPVCRQARGINKRSDKAAREFFAGAFHAYRVSNNGESVGRFTGYYEATMKGSKRRKKPYVFPVYGRPKELVMVNMKDFNESPVPRRIAGKVVGGRLRPFYTRKEIDEGALKNRGLELFWVDSPIDRLFAQIQGSGIVELANGKKMRVGYAAKNGRPYTALGRELAAAGAFKAKNMSMQTIRDWLLSHPRRATEMIQRNEAYVFFKKEKRAGAIGSQNIVLTPERSVAVDPFFIPLSAPLFIDTRVPSEHSDDKSDVFQKLVIAQDTGGAIRGPVRADIFWGAGERAFSIAGRLKGKGGYFLFLPKSITPEASE